MITLTPTAKHRLNYVLQNEDALGMLVELIPYGCNGYAYKVSLLHVINQDLECYDKIYIKQDQKSLLNNTVIDYVQKGLGWAWDYNNPNQTSTCGCGSSVGID